MKRQLALALVLAASIAAAAGTARADVSQTPVETGCPAGFEHLSVVSLEAAGPYRVPRIIDSAGNNNGFVCAHAFPEAARLALCDPCPVAVLYLFSDDDSPANSNAQAGG